MMWDKFYEAITFKIQENNLQNSVFYAKMFYLKIFRDLDKNACNKPKLISKSCLLYDYLWFW